MESSPDFKKVFSTFRSLSETSKGLENSKTKPARCVRLSAHVGFDSLPDQLVNKSIQNGFVFNILCIGETGIGKSTLMDSLFNTKFDSVPNPHNLKKVELNANSYELYENNVKLKLTIIETVGYGDQINKENSFKDLEDYIDAQFEYYLQEELKIKRSILTYQDSRIHVCLYFICPTGHGLKPLDLICMKRLDKKVNIIPIIAKADCVSKHDLEVFKSKVNKEIEVHELNIYQFPVDDESIANVNAENNNLLPFTVVGSIDYSLIEDKSVRCREYPWGIVEVENESHSDFIRLRDMLIRTNMEDMRDKTHNVHYEMFRRRRLHELGFDDNESAMMNFNFQVACKNKKAAYLEQMKKREDDARKSLIAKTREAEHELKKTEDEIHGHYELLKKEYTQDKARLDEEERILDSEIRDFQEIRMKMPHTSQFQSIYNLTLKRNKKK
ncbi:hypothetical protein QAD02_019521 [Eretmocerus hayati]|uniref:Uncharacterized protein n=1 Tax=Eretmocerus hayati TaxID=131215 RepID=A0ACC2PKA3_9HYME|nr:hypothetical protein QAD02_019521 [Eretmocerus hayati]